MSAEPEMVASGAAAAAVAAGGAAAAAGPVSTQNPFPGLRPFEPEESELFFGREDDIQDILSRLRRTRFLAVVGSSGCGKSSVVRAGLVASLQDGFMAEADAPWRIAMMRPGDNPIAQLAMELNKPEALGRPCAQTDEHVALLQATLRRGPLGIIEAVREAALPCGTRVFILVDQFEELFRFARGGPRRADEAEAAADAKPAAAADEQRLNPQDEARAFVKLLLAAAESTEVPIYVAMTMRSEFLGQGAAFPGLSDAINRGLYLLPQMSREQMADAIREPVAAAGGEISNRLVNRLLNDLGDDADQLPILQHALMRLWALWLPGAAEGPIDLTHYESVGQLQGSLSKHAEETYAELDPEQQKTAEKLFRLITDTTPDNQKIRRPRRLAEVCELAGVEQERLAAVVEKFREEQRSFLMPPCPEPLARETVIDISHESLIRQWWRLRDWADLEARETRVYRRLVERARAWDEEGRKRSDLYTGSRLAEAEEWMKGHPGRLAPAQLAFLKASRSAADMRSNVKFLLVSFLCIAALLLWAWTTYQRKQAEDQRAEADRQRQRAEEQRVIAQSKTEEAAAALLLVTQQEDLLNQVVPSLFEAFGGSAQVTGLADLKRLRAEILAANEALKQVPLTPDDLRRRGETQIKFFIKNKPDEKRVDADIVEEALKEKGFPALVLADSSQRYVPINAIWADPGEVSIEDLKTVAYVLTRAGFQIRYIGHYPDPRRVRASVPTIRVGGDPNVIEGKYGTACRPLTVQEIEDAAAFEPPLCVPPPRAPAESRADAGQTRGNSAFAGARVNNVLRSQPAARVSRGANR